MEQIKRYFPDLTDIQLQQLDALKDLYIDWNAKINVISRKDMDNFYEHHVLHSLSIAKVIDFLPKANVLDVGTGGGFPGIPLAILFPETKFLLVDSIGKKIKVVKAVAAELGLENVAAKHARAEEIKGEFDFIVSRAVTRLPEFCKWVRGKTKTKSRHAIPNGILYIKGGDIDEEIAGTKMKSKVYKLSDYFDAPFFETKAVVLLS